MNAQAEAIFREARAAHKNTANTVSNQPPDYLALAIFHTNEMQRLAAPGKVLDIRRLRIAGVFLIRPLRR